MPDAIFGEPRLAAIYDAVDDDRSDLAVYADLVDELAAATVLDIGCGTGTLACMLASRGHQVIGLDPAAASLDVARAKPGAEKVRWIEGGVAGLPPLEVDLAVMTGNAAQVFLTDLEWDDVLLACRRSIGPGGSLVFEVRDPDRRAWEAWTRDASERTIEIADVGSVRTWVEVTDVALPLVSFRHTYVFGSDGSVLTSDSTLRFRSRDEIAASLDRTNFVISDVRDAPDRPWMELVFVCTRPLA